MPNKRRIDRMGVLLLALIMGLYAAFALGHLEGLRWDSDEGINTAKAWLLDDGATLYEDVWADQPPGYTVLLAEAYGFFGEPGEDALRLARTLTVLLSLFGILGVALAAREMAIAARFDERAAWSAALGAAALLCLAPNFFWASRAAMIGLPAFSLAALAMGLALVHLRSGRRVHLALAALALGLSLWTKLQMIYLGLPWGFALLWRHRRAFRAATIGDDATRSAARLSGEDAGGEVGAVARERSTDNQTVVANSSGDRRALFLDMLTLALGSLGPLALCLVYYDRATFIDQVLGSYLGTRAAYPVSLSANLEVLGTWLFSDNAGLLALALAGAIAVLRLPNAGGVLALAWALLAVLTALQHAPLWLKDHLEPLMFALAALAGTGIGWLVDALLDRRSRGAAGIRNAGSTSPSPSWLWMIPAIGFGAYLLVLPHVLRVDASLLRARSYHNDGEVLVAESDEFRKQTRREDEIQAAAALIQRFVAPDETVVTDHQLVSIHAGRKVTARSAAFSSRAVGVGAYTDELLIESVLENDAPLVLMWDEDIAAFGGFQEWLADEGFGPPFELGKDRWAYVRPDRRAEPYRATMDGTASFGGVADLIGYEIRPSAAGLDVSLYWATLGRSDAPLSIFVHLIEPGGETIGQHDGPPDEGRRSTLDWPIPAVVVDGHRLELAGDIPTGSSLRIGVYDPASGERVALDVGGEPVDGDALMLPIAESLD